ncbi:hypothetical protein L873DRAFT_1846862 [Choiromyces venosus 120613-1]|uniref:AIG1-type G domain-containing protein n=1 Tax=Choiromyces venosus 120613-1 TaxID=1336337 RepID=A0A3N4J706_9PEZI|nr:hypothetical protein L873DRAFT_1846862 [Choiromyces venosus 120613-1]
MTQLPDPPRKSTEMRISSPEVPEAGGSNHEVQDYPSDLEVQPGIPVIFVMGVSGAGKSSFIKALGGKDPEGESPETSPFESVTHEVAIYKATLDSQEMLLVDTPGFEDNKTSNLKTIQKICEEIVKITNNPAFFIHGAVYVHNIATSRWTAGDVRTWDILKALCGNAAMGNVIVATTRWPADYENKNYEMLEKRNLEEYWKGVLGTARLSEKDTHNPKTVIQRLLELQTQPFQAQEELSKGRTPSDTSAVKIPIAEGQQALIEAEKEKEEALAELARVSLQVQQLQSQNAPKPTQPPPPETEEQNAADYKIKMDALLLGLESAITADKERLEKIKSSEKTLQEEIQQVQASMAEKEKLLKTYNQSRRKIEFADELKTWLDLLEVPIRIREILMENIVIAALVVGAAVVDAALLGLPFCGFILLGACIRRSQEDKSISAARKSSKASRKADPESGIPTTDTAEGGMPNGGSDEDEGVKTATTTGVKEEMEKEKGGPAR